MSLFERWAPSPTSSEDEQHARIPFRLQICGHVIYSALGRFQESHCPICGDVDVPVCPRFGGNNHGDPGRDYVPTPELGWSGLEQSESRRLKVRNKKTVWLYVFWSQWTVCIRGCLQTRLSSHDCPSVRLLCLGLQETCEVQRSCYTTSQEYTLACRNQTMLREGAARSC